MEIVWFGGMCWFYINLIGMRGCIGFEWISGWLWCVWYLMLKYFVSVVVGFEMITNVFN